MQVVRESTYEIRVDGQVFVRVYVEQNVTNVSLENRKEKAIQETNTMPNRRETKQTQRYVRN